MTTGADVIAGRLAAMGCRYAFGIPGGEVLAILDALDRAGIRFVLTKHENPAGFMAEGAWHATGAPGILVATIGPGVANAVNVVANAHQDRVPLIFLTGCVDATDADTYTHQVFDHQAVLRPIVKATFRANAGSLAAMMDKALAIATEGQPGPVHIDVPIGVAEGRLGAASPAAASAPATAQSAADMASLPGVHAAAAPPLATTVATGPALDAARAWLAAAERPIAIAGVDALNAGAADAVADLCHRRGIPLITTYKAKGMLPEDDPLALGGAGLSPKADRILLPLVRAADLVLLLGYDPIEMRIGWRDPWPADARVVDLTPVIRTHGMHQVALTLLGDVSANVAALVAAPSVAASGDTSSPAANEDVLRAGAGQATLRGSGGALPGAAADASAQLEASPADAPEAEMAGATGPVAGTWPDGAPGAARQALRVAFAAGATWGPAEAFATLRTSLPADAIATADSGAHRILFSQMWTCHAPRTLLQSSALCTMGCAVPLAAGYQLARPEATVAAVVGDAGLEMILGELATLRDLSLPVIVVVLVDSSLALIEMKQRGAQRRNVGVDFGATDFPAVAAALGGHGVWIDDAASLAAEAEAALARRERFTLLAVRIDRRGYDGAF